MKLKVIRDKEVGEGTLGRMFIEEEFVAFTLEQNWENNLPRVSCIPAGTYPLGTKEYGRFWDKYDVPIPIIRDTEPRSEILIHPANYPKDLLGCIAVGDSKDDKIPAVWNSRKTWKKLLPFIYECNQIEIIDETNTEDHNRT